MGRQPKYRRAKASRSSPADKHVDPSQRRLWYFANSPFGLWLLTAVIFGSGATAAGWILAEKSACKTTVAALAEHYDQLERELSARNDKLYRDAQQIVFDYVDDLSILNEKLENLSKETDKPAYVEYKKFDGRPSYELKSELITTLYALRDVAEPHFDDHDTGWARFSFDIQTLQKGLPYTNCGFRGKAAVDSDAFQPLIPTQPSHRFRLKPATA